MCWDAPHVPEATPEPKRRPIASRAGSETDGIDRRRAMAGLIAGGTIRTSPLGILAPPNSVLPRLTGS